MTAEAQAAVRNSYQFEAKKDGLRQNQDGSWKLMVNIHPNDFEARFCLDQMGQRYMCVFVPLADDDTPKEQNEAAHGFAKDNAPASGQEAGDRFPPAPDLPVVRERWQDVPYTKQAAMRCGEAEFHKFLVSAYPVAAAGAFDSAKDNPAAAAAAVVRIICGVKSRSEIVRDTMAGSKWKLLDDEFYVWRNYGAVA